MVFVQHFLQTAVPCHYSLALEMEVPSLPQYPFHFFFFYLTTLFLSQLYNTKAVTMSGTLTVLSLNSKLPVELDVS